MGTDGLGKKLAIAAAAVGAILLVLRIVGGRSGEDSDDGDAIDRVETGRSDDEGGGGSVETGLERVSTADDDGDTGTDGVAADEMDDEDEGEAAGTDRTGGPDTGDTEDGSDGEEVAVEAAGGRFDDLDLFDYVAIAGAAFEAAREEYRNRT